MIYLAAGALLVAALSSMGTVHVVRSLIRSHSRERDALLNKIMHLAGKTWEPPPAQEPEPVSDPFEEFTDTAAMPYLAD